jgi:hypothetical protein
MTKRLKHQKEARDGGRFLALPHSVIDSPAYRGLSYPAKALLIDIARQYTGTNNGSLVACAKYLNPLGWNSNSTISRALHNLLDSGLLIQTRLGMKPNRAAWYAIGWYQLNERKGIELTLAQYLARKSEWKIKTLTPAKGVGQAITTPAAGLMIKPLQPDKGAIQPTSRLTATPDKGEYLELPSHKDVSGLVHSPYAKARQQLTPSRHDNQISESVTVRDTELNSSNGQWCEALGEWVSYPKKIQSNKQAANDWVQSQLP